MFKVNQRNKNIYININNVGEKSLLDNDLGVEKKLFPCTLFKMPKEVPAEQSPESLGEIAKRLREIADKIEVISTVMGVHGINAMTVSHFSALELGLSKLVAFAGAADAALQEKMVSTEKYGVPLVNGVRTQADTNGSKPRKKDGKRKGESDTESKS